MHLTAMIPVRCPHVHLDSRFWSTSIDAAPAFTRSPLPRAARGQWTGPVLACQCPPLLNLFRASESGQVRPRVAQYITRPKSRTMRLTMSHKAASSWATSGVLVMLESGKAWPFDTMRRRGRSNVRMYHRATEWHQVRSGQVYYSAKV
jgi:hypothetical protein